MSYLDQWNKLNGEGKVQERQYRIYRWESQGDSLIGRLVRIEPFKYGKFSEQVNSYLIDTDDGMISTVCGKSVDGLLSESDVGKLVCITYNGKVRLQNGRTMNDFSVQVAHTSEIGPESPDDDIPF